MQEADEQAQLKKKEEDEVKWSSVRMNGYSLFALG